MLPRVKFNSASAGAIRPWLLWVWPFEADRFCQNVRGDGDDVYILLVLVSRYIIL